MLPLPEGGVQGYRGTCSRSQGGGYDKPGGYIKPYNDGMLNDAKAPRKVTVSTRKRSCVLRDHHVDTTRTM